MGRVQAKHPRRWTARNGTRMSDKRTGWNSTLRPGKPLVRSSRPKRGKPMAKVNRKRKAKRYERDYAGPYADWIRSQGCLACEAHPKMTQMLPTQAHHVRTRGAGGSAQDLVPLCWDCHHDVHSMGRRTFERHYGIDLKAAARRLWATYHNEEEA